MTILRSYLSMLYHSTIPAYRDEMHLDLDQAYKRFGIPVADVDWRQAVAEVDAAAFFVRDADTLTKRATAKQQLLTAGNRLMALLAARLPDDLAAAAGMAQNQQGGTGSLLAKLYTLAYNPAYRAQSPAGTAIKDQTPAVQASWDAVRNALTNGTPPNPNDCKVLCDGLAQEFNDSIWLLIW